MIRLTNLADYGVVLMGELAKTNDLVSSRDLSERTGLPGPTIAKILNMLNRANLVTSHRGLKGGFALSRPASDISAAHIIEAIDGPIALTNCADGGMGSCDFDQFCRMREPWQVINEAVRTTLDGISLETLISGVSPELLAAQFGVSAPAAQ